MDLFRRIPAVVLTLAFVLLPVLTHLDRPTWAQTSMPGILCSQTDAGPAGPSSNPHDDCSLTCALAQAQLPAPDPAPALRREAAPARIAATLVDAASPGEALAEQRIRGPPGPAVA